MINVAVLWIVNEEHEILLAQRAYHKKQYPGMWGAAVAGKVEHGENYDNAVIRETEEELGLTIAEYVPHFLFEKDYVDSNNEPRKFGIYYAVLPKAKSSLIQVNSYEVAGCNWFTLESIQQKMRYSADELIPSANVLWPEIIQSLKKEKVL